MNLFLKCKLRMFHAKNRAASNALAAKCRQLQLCRQPE
jgi:hypothetical protein